MPKIGNAQDVCGSAVVMLTHTGSSSIIHLLKRAIVHSNNSDAFRRISSGAEGYNVGIQAGFELRQ